MVEPSSEPTDTYACLVCEWCFEEADGDPDHGIAPGTCWDDVPDDWLCPHCGAGKTAFAKSAAH